MIVGSCTTVVRLAFLTSPTIKRKVSTPNVFVNADEDRMWMSAGAGVAVGEGAAVGDGPRGGGGIDVGKTADQELRKAPLETRGRYAIASNWAPTGSKRNNVPIPATIRRARVIRFMRAGIRQRQRV
jgi:hypothetical protein